jgi:hypothetical protein
MNPPALVSPTADSPAPLAAPVLREYPQFHIIPIPEGHKAFRAFAGVIQPFEDDRTAREFLRRVEADSPIEIEEGRIVCQSQPSRPRRIDSLLVATQIRFTVIVLEFAGAEHPRAYVRFPEISRSAHPNHPHLRADNPLIVGGRVLQRLCIYSGAIFTFSNEYPRIVQFLDQLSAYLGRHTIWLKTRVELSSKPGGGFRIPDRDEVIVEIDPRAQMNPLFSRQPIEIPRWSGYWPGKSAPSGAQAHLRTIAPSQECWCCSGISYGDCHRRRELEITRQKSAA